MKLDAGDGSGTDTSFLAMPVLNWENSDWNALLKWAVCVVAPGVAGLPLMSVSLSTVRPFGPNSCTNTCETLGTSAASVYGAPWAEARRAWNSRHTRHSTES